MIDKAHGGSERDAFLEAMNVARFGAGVHYLPLHEHPFYQERFGWRPEQWPHAMRVGRQTVSLPLSPAISGDDAGHVIGAVRSVIGRQRRS
ncbi:DegT/DnrJ/EryC1/StrS family aminotransferase [Dyella silvae]|uniref:DegT/DnrJ/EryC1/StrS family aminotransferase n=1 Tax=Dyella silvae TaxID=2994424 RepID=UPI0022642228|nr:DegT/DnrJ/EryC1/StrS family aminotransferase [Dyella silvae]